MQSQLGLKLEQRKLPLDVLTIVDDASFPGVLISVRPVGLLDMVDQEEPDQKILAVPNKNPRFDQIHTIDQVFPHKLREIEHFFNIYKELEGRETSTLGWGDPAEARKVIGESRRTYLNRSR